MPRALIACDKFKGSLSAIEACQAIARGLPQDWQCDICPIADGGEGFTEAMVQAAAGRWIECESHDALGRSITASYGIIQQQGKTVAVMEMAAASGIWRISREERDIFRSSTFGVGEMLRHATEIMKADEILVGIGGSATNDGGAGMAAALGVKFLDVHGNRLSGQPLDMQKLHTIERDQTFRLPPIRVACDVGNPLCGSQGASHIYGPQKGATAEQVPILDGILKQIAELSGSASLAEQPGAGAAGGLGFGLMAFAGAEMIPGFSLVSEALHLRERIANADLVITGEGSLDEQSLQGKGPFGIALLAKEQQKLCIGFAGYIEARDQLAPHFEYLADIVSLGHTKEYCMTHAAPLLEELVRLWQADR
jgi:glycerate 2-kinase